MKCALKGKTVLLTTHYMEEAERLCDRVAIMDHGRIVAIDSPAELVRTYGGEERLIFTLDQTLPPEVENSIRLLGRLEIEGERVSVQSETGQASFVYEVVSLLTNHGIHFRNLRTEQPTLEDVFLKLTGREMKD